MSFRVLYSFPNRIGVPGIGMIAWHQVSGLVAQGAEVHLFCGSCERPLPGLASITETMRLGPMRVPYRLIGDDAVYSYHDWCVARLLRRMTSRPDIVHCWPLGALRTLRVARELGIKTVLERPNAHTRFAYRVVAQEHAKIGLPIPKAHTHEFNHRRLAREELEYSAADQLICPSEFVAKTFREEGFPEQRITLHQYGYDAKEFHSDNDRAKAGNDRPFTVLFAGRCEPRKGLHYALNAWHASGAAASGRFLIAGSFVNGYEDFLKEQLAHPSVSRLGFTNDVAGVMRQSDVLVLPSVEEGSALVTYEARGAGLILAVSASSGARCEHMHDSLVHDTGDVAMLREHLSLLYEKADLRAQLRQASLQGIHELTWDRASRRLIEVYAQSLGRQG